MRNYRYRTNWRGKLILQVSELLPSHAENPPPSGVVCTPWRDATVQDVCILLPNPPETEKCGKIMTPFIGEPGYPCTKRWGHLGPCEHQGEA